MFPLEPLGEEERPDEVAERGDCEREPDDVAGAHDRSAPGGRSVSPGSAISRSQPRTRSVASAKKRDQDEWKEDVSHASVLRPLNAQTASLDGRPTPQTAILTVP